jgi:hypothetical protein
LGFENLGVLPLRVVSTIVGSASLGESDPGRLGSLLGQVILKGLDNLLWLGRLRGRSGSGRFRAPVVYNL